MDEKQLADRLRDIERRNQTGELLQIADELDQPAPEPGLVWYAPRNANSWRLGWWNGNWLRDAETGYVVEKQRIKPARILGARQVAVDVKPVSEWNSGTNAIEIWMYEINPHSPNSRTLKTITREEAARMEARDDTA